MTEPEFVPAPAVRQRYHVSDMTLWRWLRDQAMGFPQPVYIGRFRYWRVADLEAWEDRLPRERAATSGEAA